MAKRGRPSVYMKHYGHEETLASALCPDQTKRTHAAMYYRAAAYSVLAKAASDIPYLDGIFRVDEAKGACHQKAEIMEQLGRMKDQDGYSTEDVLTVAGIAAAAYHHGNTVKEIKQYILMGRKYGIWNYDDEEITEAASENIGG